MLTSLVFFVKGQKLSEAQILAVKSLDSDTPWHQRVQVIYMRLTKNLDYKIWVNLVKKSAYFFVICGLIDLQFCVVI